MLTEFHIDADEDSQTEEVVVEIFNFDNTVMLSQPYNHIKLSTKQAKELRELLERVY